MQWLTTKGTTPSGGVYLTTDSGWFVCLWTLARLTSLCFDSPDIASSQTYREHRFPQFLCCCVHNCCYVEVAFCVPLLHHCLLCRNLVISVSSILHVTLIPQDCLSWVAYRCTIISFVRGHTCDVCSSWRMVVHLADADIFWFRRHPAFLVGSHSSWAP
jgi:hypothetical protein